MLGFFQVAYASLGVSVMLAGKDMAHRNDHLYIWKICDHFENC